MSNLKNIAGTKIKLVDTDITASASTNGTVFINNVTGKLKYISETFTPPGIASSTWSTITSMPHSGWNDGASFGSVNSMVVVNFTGTADTNYYNGSTWSSMSDSNTLRYGTGNFGEGTDGIVAAGRNGSFTPSNFFNLTEKWNGSTWSELGETNYSMYVLRGGYGTDTTAGKIVAGDSSNFSPRGQGYSEYWNGSSWSTAPSAPTSNDSSESFGFGKSDNCTIVGSDSVATCAYWNGSSWSNITNSSNQRGINSGGGASGTSGSVCGTPTGGAFTEGWNGSAWTEYADLNTGGRSQFSSTNATAGEYISAGRRTATTTLADSEKFGGTPSPTGYTVKEVSTT